MNLQTVNTVTETPSAIFWFSALAMSTFFVASIGATMLLLKRSPSWSIGEALSEEAANRDPAAGADEFAYSYDYVHSIAFAPPSPFTTLNIPVYAFGESFAIPKLQQTDRVCGAGP